MMSMEMEVFSIREYASRMRDVDMVKCWPFKGVDEDDVKAMLPPITIKKFKWWFDELELVRSTCADGYEENSRRKKLQDKGTIVDLGSESVESMRRTTVRKAKPKAKAPKKRSIVELFAVSPPVERVNSEEDDDDEDEENANDKLEDSDEDSIQRDGFPNTKLFALPNVGLNCKGKRKVKKKGLVCMLEKQKKVVKNLKKKVNRKKKRQKEVSVDMRTKKEEKSSKLAIPSCSAHGTGILVAVSSHIKKPNLKRLDTEKKSKTQRTSKLHTEHQRSVFPVRSILKNQMKLFPIKNSINCISRDASTLKQHETQPVGKHVTFSVKDDVQGRRRKIHPTAELELQNFCNLHSEVNGAFLVKENAAKRGKTLSIQEMKETQEEISGCEGNEIDVQPVTSMQSSVRLHGPDAPNFLLQHVSQENMLNRAVAFGQSAVHNQSLQRFEGRKRELDALYTCTSGIPSMSEGRIMPKLTVPMSAYSSDASSCSQRLFDLSGDPHSQFAAGCSMDHMKAYPLPSSSYSATFNENADLGPVFPSQTTRENYKDHTLHYQWLPHLDPRELMRTISSLPEWKSSGIMHGEIGINEDFFGLPLNSQGELIRLNSDGNVGFNQFGGTSASSGPSLPSAMDSVVDRTYFRSWNGITPSNYQPEVSMFKDSGKEIESFPMPSRLNILEQCGTRTNMRMRGMDPSFYSLQSDMDQMKVSHVGSRQDDQVHRLPKNDLFQQHVNPSQISLHFSQSTMRLMGQEFKIGGGRELQALEGREVLRDKEIITEQHGNAAIRGFVKSQDLPESIIHPILGKLKNTVTHLSEARIHPASRSVSQMMVPESKFLSYALDGRYNVVNQNGYKRSECNLMAESYPHLPVSATPLSVSRKSVLEESFVCGHKYPKVSQLLLPSSPCDSTQNLGRSFIQLQNKQTPVHNAKFAFKFPFSHSERGRDIQPSWCESTFKVKPPWLLESRQKGASMDVNQKYSAPGGSCPALSISDVKYQTDPSIYQPSEPCDLFPHCALQKSASLAHCTSVPVRPGYLPDSTLQSRYGEKMMMKKLANSRIRAIVPTHGERTKKRLASASDVCMRGTKVPKFGVQEDSSQPVGTSPNFEREVQCSVRELVSASPKVKANTAQCGKIGASKDETRVCSMVDPSEIQGAPKSGPVKLTAGAKYVLKPCQKKDQTNSKPTQPTIPFAATTAAGKVFTSEKSPKIYRI